jgi:SAM-dependent methyltransferase
MSGGWQGSAAGRPAGDWAVWKFNWLVSHKLVAALRRAAPHARGELLDVGCGSRPFEPLFAGGVTRYLGSDLPGSSYTGGARVDVRARAEALPFRDASFDTVLAISVLTYLSEPGRLPREAARVLRPGGALLLEATQMARLHDEPHDYFRFTRYGAQHLVEGAGLELVECIPIGGLWARVGNMLLLGLSRLNRGPTRPLTEVPVRLLYVAIQLVCEVLDRLFTTPGDHLGHLVVARKPAPGAGEALPAAS